MEPIDENEECVANETVNSESYVESQEDAYSFYARYAKCVGFGVCTKSSLRSKISKHNLLMLNMLARDMVKNENRHNIHVLV